MKADYHDLIFERWLRARNSGELVWQTKKGESIPLKDMSDEHLNNAIAHLENKEKEDLMYM